MIPKSVESVETRIEGLKRVFVISRENEDYQFPRVSVMDFCLLNTFRNKHVIQCVRDLYPILNQYNVILVC